MIIVANKKRSIERIQAEYPGAIILDVTSSSPYRAAQILSPFYPHGGIPIPGDSHELTATCVEGIWQGLKVFENSGIDIECFRNTSMKGIKRTVRKFGRPLGHQYGVYSSKLLSYNEAKSLIYLPSYKYVLENIPDVQHSLKRIADAAKEKTVILLDYNVNPDNADSSKPLSHAELIKMFIEGRYPERIIENVPMVKTVKKKTRKAAFDNTAEIDIQNLLSGEALGLSEIIERLKLHCSKDSLKKYILSLDGIQANKMGRKVIYTLRTSSEPTLL